MSRQKDIYKNNKGQTIAPRTVEMKFTGVPGIQDTFLVGDAKPYNVLLIVPDNNDPVLTALSDLENRNEYFHQIITAANKDLSPYERVINFEVLERSFELEKGELTPKGSFNRKTIVKNFQDELKNLYLSNFVLLTDKDLQVSIPRWFFRDLGILENDIVLLDGAAVTTPLKGRGIGSAMIEDFSARMAELDVKVIKAHFLHGSFYLKLKFKVDKKWGALVKFL